MSEPSAKKQKSEGMANNSWISIAEDSDFSLQNLPWGVFKKHDGKPHIGVAIGEQVFDVTTAFDLGLFTGSLQKTTAFQQPVLNEFMGLGRSYWREARQTLTRLLSKEEGLIRDDKSLQQKLLVSQSDVEMLLPARIGDYTDFYASRQHASNIGTMFRGKDNALQPNWLHLPVGYHGRASSVVVSGTNVRRPYGQSRPKEDQPPIFGASKVIDLELEVAWFVGPGNKQGEPIPMEKVEEHMFGMVLMNDWTARDIQKWEYVPLGPFLAKNWATSISPWVVTFDALEPFRKPFGEGKQDPEPLPYLRDQNPAFYDISLQASIKTPKSSKPFTFTRANYLNMYWSMKQQTVHHAISGCNLNPGDLMGSGTISGSDIENSVGSLSEKTWGGSKTWSIPETGESRTYIQDGDEIILTGFAQGAGYRVGFGKCSGTLLPAHPLPSQQ